MTLIAACRQVLGVIPISSEYDLTLDPLMEVVKDDVKWAAWLEKSNRFWAEKGAEIELLTGPQYLPVVSVLGRKALSRQRSMACAAGYYVRMRSDPRTEHIPLFEEVQEYVVFPRDVSRQIEREVQGERRRSKAIRKAEREAVL
jgi:hypothetical protein